MLKVNKDLTRESSQEARGSQQGPGKEGSPVSVSGTGLPLRHVGAGLCLLPQDTA